MECPNIDIYFCQELHVSWQRERCGTWASEKKKYFLCFHVFIMLTHVSIFYQADNKYLNVYFKNR